MTGQASKLLCCPTACPGTWMACAFVARWALVYSAVLLAVLHLRKRPKRTIWSATLSKRAWHAAQVPGPGRTRHAAAQAVCQRGRGAEQRGRQLPAAHAAVRPAHGRPGRLHGRACLYAGALRAARPNGLLALGCGVAQHLTRLSVSCHGWCCASAALSTWLAHSPTGKHERIARSWERECGLPALQP